MKLYLEIEIVEPPDGDRPRVVSVTCDSVPIKGEQDSIGRTCGTFFKIPNETDLALDLVEWEE